LSNGNAKLLDFGLPTVSGLREQAKSKNYVYLGSSSTSEAAVYMTTSLDQAGKRLVQPETTPASWMAAASKPVTWKRGGFTIEGLLYLPPQASSGKVPLVVNVHGGPRGQFTDSYSPLTNLLIGQGWAVLITNPRGSTGYGVAFEAANKDDMGNGDYLDTMIVIPNEKLLVVAQDAGFFESFRIADDVLRQGVQGISDIITISGIINRDFADVKTTMAGMGHAVMGTAIRSGEDRAIEAAQAAMASPLLDAGAIDGARGILINITGSSNLRLSEVNEASSLIQSSAHEDANIIFGAVLA